MKLVAVTRLKRSGKFNLLSFKLFGLSMHPTFDLQKLCELKKERVNDKLESVDVFGTNHINHISFTVYFSGH